MQTVEEKLAKSLTAESVELIPHLPYLLQDLWELGSSPKDMLDMITRHIHVSDQTRVLDLACGKGAVSIKLAQELGCRVKGIDIIPEFIKYANNKAKEYGVEKLCEFATGDINESVKSEKDYDIVILGSVGDVLGTPEETIGMLKKTIKSEGYILIDDGYGKEGSNVDYYTKDEWTAIFKKSKVRLLEDKIIDSDELADINRDQQGFIVKRANELKKTYPEKAFLFEGYINSQQAECDELENEMMCVTMLLQTEK